MDFYSPIRDQTLVCQALFNRCVSTASTVASVDWFETQQGVFNIWAAGLKATKLNRASLDHRVRYRDDIRELICALLEGLAESLEKCMRTGTSYFCGAHSNLHT